MLLALTRLRRLFPTHCFEERYASSTRTKAQTSYHSTTGNITLSGSKGQVQKSQALAASAMSCKLLVKGKSSRSDRLLEWVVSTSGLYGHRLLNIMVLMAFKQDQALELMRHRSLATFSLCIMANKLEPHEILEVRK